MERSLEARCLLWITGYQASSWWVFQRWNNQHKKSNYLPSKGSSNPSPPHNNYLKCTLYPVMEGIIFFLSSYIRECPFSSFPQTWRYLSTPGRPTIPLHIPDLWQFFFTNLLLLTHMGYYTKDNKQYNSSLSFMVRKGEGEGK